MECWWRGNAAYGAVVCSYPAVRRSSAAGPIQFMEPLTTLRGGPWLHRHRFLKISKRFWERPAQCLSVNNERSFVAYSPSVATKEKVPPSNKSSRMAVSWSLSVIDIHSVLYVSGTSDVLYVLTLSRLTILLCNLYFMFHTVDKSMVLLSQFLTFCTRFSETTISPNPASALPHAAWSIRPFRCQQISESAAQCVSPVLTRGFQLAFTQTGNLTAFSVVVTFDLIYSYNSTRYHK
jgi:hypothetical protein